MLTVNRSVVLATAVAYPGVTLRYRHHESRMSLWYFLSDWFGGVPTLGALFKRSMINAIWAIALIFVMMFFQISAEYAAVVFYGVLVVNGVMFFVYQRQRQPTRD